MSIVYMKVLESSSHRYDKGIKILTGGKLGQVYESALQYVKEGDTVLDIGCGTGNLAILAAIRGAKIKAIDVNPEMLDIAKKKAKDQEFSGSIEFIEQGVVELDAENTEYDVIMSSLCFSELNEEEIDFTLPHVKRLLKDDGAFILIDEGVPKGIFRKLLFYIIRIPLVVITYLLTQTTTHPLRGIQQRIVNAELNIEKEESTGSLQFFVARRGESA